MPRVSSLARLLQTTLSPHSYSVSHQSLRKTLVQKPCSNFANPSAIISPSYVVRQHQSSFSSISRPVSALSPGHLSPWSSRSFLEPPLQHTRPQTRHLPLILRSPFSQPHSLKSSNSAPQMEHTETSQLDSRSKRKHPSHSSPSNERPMKQLRASDRDISASPHQNGAPSDVPMHGSSNGASSNGVEVPFDDETRQLSRVPTAAESMEWQATIERVVKSVVAIHFCQTCSFDTDSAVSSEATGFVVDAERGYILTNRVMTKRHPLRYL
jgi:hypothetical protein